MVDNGDSGDRTMKKLILAATLALTAMPTAFAGQTSANPGTVISNVYQNPAAGYGYGIRYGFGLPAPAYADRDGGYPRTAIRKRQPHRIN
jgi:hypothetical protein